MLAAAEVDLAIVSEPGGGGRIVFEPLFWDACMLVAPLGHCLGKRMNVEIKELAPYPLMVNPLGTTLRTVLDQAFSKVGLALEAAQQISTMPAMVRMVEAGFGLGIAPAKALQGLATERCDLVPLKENVGWTVGVARMASRSEAPASTALRSKLLAHYAP